MSKIILDNVQGGYNLQKINSNFEKIETALNTQVLYRQNPEGEDNTVKQDIDMDGNDLINVGDVQINGHGSFVEAIEYVEQARDDAEGFAQQAANSASQAAASAQQVEDAKLIWRGAWDSLTAYDVNDAVENGGTSYICILAHTNEEPPNASYWDVLAMRGADGAVGDGTGDVISNTATSVDNEIALFSGTSGKIIKRAVSTGILKATSGVLSTAVGGTDYLRPSDNTALSTSYDNTASGLAATNVQELGDELADSRPFINVKNFGAVGDGIASDSASINDALAYAASIGGATVFVPAGDYRLTSILQMGANTTLLSGSGVRYLKDHDATFLNNGLGYTTSSVIPAYGGNGNIVIDGGVWEGFAFGIFDSYTGFALGYGKNITLRNIVLKDSIGGGHSVDMSACDGVLIENCKFLGYAPPDGGSISIQDCIQLDHSVEGSFPYFGVPTFRQNKNITVRGCYFGANPDNADVRFRAFSIGVGQHGAVYDQFAENILIEGNTFNGCVYAGVRAWNWVGARVVSNYFDSCNVGVRVSATAAGSISSQDIDRVQQNQAQAGRDIVVSNNAFTNITTFAVFISDITFGTDTTIRHRNVVVANNTANSIGEDFCVVRNVNGAVISNNTVSNARYLVAVNVSPSSNISIHGNVVRNSTTGAADTGAIWITQPSDNIAICDNTFDVVNIGRGVHVSAGASNGLIRGNTFRGIAGYAVIIQNTSAQWIVQGNIFITTNLATDTTLQTPVYVTSSCTDCAVIGNQNFATNTTAPKPCEVQGGARNYADIQYTGTPEGAITAPPGSICRNISGGAGTTLYVKQSGTGNTGWVGK